MSQNAVDPPKKIEERIQVCAHCGAPNPPGLLLCLACGRDPVSGRDLFAPPQIPTPPSSLGLSYNLTVTMPDPILVPDPLPVPTMEDFIAPPARAHPVPPPTFRAPPPNPREMAPLLSPLPRWTIGFIGLAALALLGMGTAGSLVALNLPGGICLGSLWLALAIVWLGIIFARRGESLSRTTGARRRLVTALGQRLFEITPGPARDQRAQRPGGQIASLSQPASQLVYLASMGERSGQLTQVLLGTLCALAAGDHVDLATQTYDVLTASPLRRRFETVRRTVVSRRALYTGAGYLEKLILDHLRHTPTAGARELAAAVLRQAGADVLERIAAETGSVPPPGEGEASDLDAQVAALRAFCDELKALNPDLYAQLSQDVEETVHAFLRAARQRSR